MSTIAGSPPPVSHTLPVHGPIGKPAVGFESVADKDALLPPVDATEAERLHRRDVVVKLSDDAERDRQRHSQEEEQEPPQDEPAEAFVLAGAKPHQARRLAEFDAPALPPGSLLDQTI